jgi:predicted HicB family RNase H-like nuclease
MYERLAAAAKERDLSVNFLVNRAVEQFIARLIPVDEIQWTRDP